MKSLLFIPLLFVSISSFAQFNIDSVKHSGYSTINELGGSFGIAANDNYLKYFPWFSFKTSHGYQFNDHFYLGAGTGFDVARDRKLVAPKSGDHLKYITVPLFQEFRYTILRKRVSPFISEQAGYTFFTVAPPSAWNKKFIGGPMTAAQIGLRVYMNEKVAFNFSVGYKFQSYIIKKTIAGSGGQWDNNNYNSLLPTNEFLTSGKRVSKYYYHFVTVLAGITF